MAHLKEEIDMINNVTDLDELGQHAAHLEQLRKSANDPIEQSTLWCLIQAARKRCRELCGASEEISDSWKIHSKTAPFWYILIAICILAAVDYYWMVV